MIYDREGMNLNLRLGKFAVTIEYYGRVGCGWGIRKWRYGHRESWWHGTARLGRFRVIW